jgi:hypothetical protein
MALATVILAAVLLVDHLNNDKTNSQVAEGEETTGNTPRSSSRETGGEPPDHRDGHRSSGKGGARAGANNPAEKNPGPGPGLPGTGNTPPAIPNPQSNDASAGNPMPGNPAGANSSAENQSLEFDPARQQHPGQVSPLPPGNPPLNVGNPLPNNPPGLPSGLPNQPGVVTTQPNQPGPLVPVGNNSVVAGKQGVPATVSVVNFLGSVGRGTRFVIIADRSGSMNSNVHYVNPATQKIIRRPSIDCLRDEMLRTLKSAQPGSYFYVCFFDSGVRLWPFGNIYLEGGGSLNQALPWVKSATALGGTRPLTAFQKAFGLQPRPDVIFFMTDGQFPNIAPQIAQLNSQAPTKVVINTIHFNNTSNYVRWHHPAENRYAQLLSAYQFPPAVQTQLQMLALVPAGQQGKFKKVPYEQQLLKIAQDSGGTFTEFGEEHQPNLVQRLPLMAQIDQLTPRDPIYPKRPGSRFKAYPVVLQGGKTYQIDMIASFNTYLTLEGPNGQVLLTNDHSLGSNSLLTVCPPATGSYRIIATTSSAAVMGPYILTVIDQPPQAVGGIPGGPNPQGRGETD